MGTTTEGMMMKSPMLRNVRVVLSYGMGVESTAILLRWLEDPASRDFALEDLIVITAMTGDEFPNTGRLVEEHILPRLRQHGVRYIQVARGGRTQDAGVVTLDDSRSPRKVHLDGVYKLSDELLSAGTVPQMRPNHRLCSQKAKGWPLDTWIEREMGGRTFRHVMGFNAEEIERVERDRSYSSAERKSEYPLVGWNWDRATCEAYIKGLTGVDWPKSCCMYCPFANGKPHILARYEANPETAAFALFIEHVSVALNPKQMLYGAKSLLSVLEKAGNVRAIELFQKRLSEAPSALYRVRRVWKDRMHAMRSVEKIAEGSRAEMERRLTGVETKRVAGALRAEIAPRSEVYPSLEEVWVVAPAVVMEKINKGFAKAAEALEEMVA